ncbi:MAG: zinc ribbon domain-containing protein [Cytophagales bacterium]|nr:MAG: zinc ribbon domain-containing protein [Cytophagales bacterium]
MSPAFCPQCGSPLKSGARFCPSCGGALASLSQAMKPNFTKGQSKSYSGTVPTPAKAQILQKVKEVLPVMEKAAPKSFSPTGAEVVNQVQSSLDKAGSWGFLLVNLLLLILGYSSDSVLGILFFSLIAGLFLFLRRNKPKPVNWVIKVILILQVIGLLALVVDTLEYPGPISILMIILLAVDLRLIFKGNQTH